jgi:hypothetical protein
MACELASLTKSAFPAESLLPQCAVLLILIAEWIFFIFTLAHGANHVHVYPEWCGLWQFQIHFLLPHFIDLAKNLAPRHIGA